LVKEWTISREKIFEGLEVTQDTKTVVWTEDGEEKRADVTLRWGWLAESETGVRSMISVVSGNRALSTEEDFDVRRGWTNQFGVFKLVGEMRAEWLDAMPEFDPADIKREGITWDIHPALEALRDTGRNWIITTCRARAESTKGKEEIRAEVERVVEARADLKRMPAPQKRRLISLVTSFASTTAYPVDQLSRVIDLFAFILNHGALITFLEELKAGGKKDIDEFLDTAENFTAAEIIGLLSVTRSKLALVQQLRSLITDPKTLEVHREGKRDITSFLATNPWIFDPELRINHKDVKMKRIVLDRDGVAPEVLNDLPVRFFDIRPDFTSYIGPSGRPLCIELKGPTHEMVLSEAHRVTNYVAALKSAGYHDLDVFVVAGKYANEARAVLDEVVEARTMDYAQMLDRTISQMSEYIEKLEGGLQSLG
jgi:hypothetical protein